MNESSALGVVLPRIFTGQGHLLPHITTSLQHLLEMLDLQLGLLQLRSQSPLITALLLLHGHLTRGATTTDVGRLQGYRTLRTAASTLHPLQSIIESKKAVLPNFWRW